MPRLFAILLVAGFTGPLFAANWPEFRGPTGQGHSTEQDLPVEWSPTKNVTWKTPIEGTGWSSPIYYDGLVYLTTAVPTDSNDRNDQSLRALCLDAATGRLIWNIEVFHQIGEKTDKIHRKNSHASPTPLTDGKHVYVHYGTNGTACLTLDGKIVWKNQELRYKPQHGNGGSPIFVGDTLVICCDGSDVDFVVALEQTTGKIRWKTDRTVDTVRKFSFATPLLIDVDGEQQIVCPGTNAVDAFDPQDGKQIWTVDYPGGYSVIPRPVFGQGLVFICTGYNKPSLLAIRPNGRGNITKTHTEWTLNRGVPHTPSLLLAGKELYLVSDNGIASCLDAKTGKQHWQQRFGGGFSASPILADGHIYFQSEAGETIVIEPGTSYQGVARNHMNSQTLASFAAADSALFVRTETDLYRIEKQ